jgi:acyl carrier protein
MDEAVIMDEVTAVLRDVFDQPSLPVTPEMTAADVVGWDSLRMILILSALEERLDLRFTTPEMDRLRCVGDLVRIIGQKRGGT